MQKGDTSRSLFILHIFGRCCMHQRIVVLGVLSLVTLVSGCSSAAWYSAGQSYQRNECLKVPNQAERERCLDNANTDYNTYTKETSPAP